jgi:hypothetical protein
MKRALNPMKCVSWELGHSGAPFRPAINSEAAWWIRSRSATRAGWHRSHIGFWDGCAGCQTPQIAGAQRQLCPLGGKMSPRSRPKRRVKVGGRSHAPGKMIMLASGWEEDAISMRESRGAPASPRLCIAKEDAIISAHRPGRGKDSSQPSWPCTSCMEGEWHAP